MLGSFPHARLYLALSFNPHSGLYLSYSHSTSYSLTQDMCGISLPHLLSSSRNLVLLLSLTHTHCLSLIRSLPLCSLSRPRPLTHTTLLSHSSSLSLPVSLSLLLSLSHSWCLSLVVSLTRCLSLSLSITHDMYRPSRSFSMPPFPLTPSLSLSGHQQASLCMAKHQQASETKQC